MKRYLTVILLTALLLIIGCAPESEPMPAAEASPVDMVMSEVIETALPAPTAPAETAIPAITVAPEMTAAPEETFVLSEAYKTLLGEYADAEKNGFYANVDADARDASFGTDIALEWKVNPSPASYALCDLDGNGTPELIIAAGDDAARVIFDFYTLDGDKAVRPIELDFGYRANIAVFKDGLIEVSYSDSAFASGVDFYRLNGTGTEAVGSLTVTSSADDPNTMQYAFNGETISEENYTAKLAEFEATGPINSAFTPVSSIGK